MSVWTVSRLLEAFRYGDKRACARAISLVEDEADEATEVLNELYPLTGRAYRVGITGPPGAGKSTLVEKLAQECRSRGRTVGVVAVDPSSPFSGGAVLGDRIRMSSLFTDPGVFIRSMATRGGMGGLAGRTKEVCDILDAFGRDFILMETVGVGQIELDIAQAAQTTVVVLVPESGDSIQMMKAGLMEIGDVFCVNKSDRQGADRLVVAIGAMLELRDSSNGWMPPVVKTNATHGKGTIELLVQVEKHRSFLEGANLLALRRRESARTEIRELVEAGMRRDIWDRPDVEGLLSELVEQVCGRNTTPYRASAEILKLVRAPAPGSCHKDTKARMVRIEQEEV